VENDRKRKQGESTGPVFVSPALISDMCAYAESCGEASDNAVQCGVSDDVTSASAEARRDSGISVASSLVTTCASELPLVSQHAAIVEEPGCNLYQSVSDVDRQAVTGNDNTQPPVLPWTSLPADQGYS